MNTKLIGREKEKLSLLEVIESNKPELVAVYGRRRVGKTFLIRTVCSGEGLFFEVVGQKDAPLRRQLEIFSNSFSRVFFNGAPLAPFKSWKDAFELLTVQVEKVKSTKPIILFFDELPWLATKRGGLLESLDHYWNARWHKFNNLKVILCGSAASWMLEKLIHAKGGLFNRITQTFRIEPFSLTETSHFLKSKNLQLPSSQVLESLMTFGGIPQYLEQIKRSRSLTQSIAESCFTRGGALVDEFGKLFRGLFDQGEIHEEIVKILGRSPYGITRQALTKAMKVSSGGTFTKRIKELIEAGFIIEWNGLGDPKDEVRYRLVDEYSLFYCTWISSVQGEIAADRLSSNYWHVQRKSPRYNAWAGILFEIFCHKNAHALADLLGLEDTAYRVSHWRSSSSKGGGKEGAQVDLLYDREDDEITLCEVKYNVTSLPIKEVVFSLERKREIFQAQTKTKKRVSTALVLAHPLKEKSSLKNFVDRIAVVESLL